ncbi:substrate-binding periplasmic protein [Marinobacter zhejiangensis]|uniref:Extracellular solute-binding protein, family 3 n=1 Tax=Marinobacter zhejiangensis TaxID=488535 RepID=A0A1I4Q708_9GAMM|nr:transporter substrate-binding domain-containing protein [Marinobacter zhejiangensis]SFM35596.1 extracellular solute-binding protein, family 3 [Marinobacter zhejiangensis]
MLSQVSARLRPVLGVVLFMAGLNAQADIRLAVPEITTLLDASGDGVYQQIFNKAMESLDYQVSQDFYPYKRALYQFKAGRADCIFSFTEVLRKTLGDGQIIASYPLGSFGYFLFSPAGQPPVSSNEELAGLRVGAVIGHEGYYAEALEYSGEVLQVHSDEQAIEMLRQGRIDVAIAALPDIQPYMDDLTYSAEFPLFLGYDRITCYDTPENRAFLDGLSAELMKLKADGTYQRLAGDHYMDFDF